MSETLAHYLREARATEAGLVQTLKVHIAATPPGHHRARLEEHLDQTRAHERLLAERIAALGQAGGEGPFGQLLSLLSAPVGFSLGLARGAARAMLSFVGLPLAVLGYGEQREEDRVLRNVRAEAASEALEIATYTAIERLAEVEGDSATAQLASRIRADEERMLEYLRSAAVELSEALGGAPRRAPKPPREPAPEPIPIRPQRTNGAPPPAPASHVSEEPELVAEVAEQGAEEEAGAEVDVQEPWEDYDRMKAAEIERRLESSSDELAAVVRLYESAGKNRQTVIRAADRRLRA